MKMLLVHEKSRIPVKAGEQVQNFRGEAGVIAKGIGSPPHHPGSTGRVWIGEGDFPAEYFPGVYDLEWIEAGEQA